MTEPVEATRHERRRRRGMLLWLLLLLALLGAVLGIGIATRGGDGGSTGASGSTSSGTGSRSGVAGATKTVGSLTAGATDVLALRSVGVGQLAGRNVVAQGVRVLAVVGDEVFWVGGTHRILVHLETSGESPPKVRAGDRVSFRGTLTRNASTDAQRFGVTKREDAGLLRRQGVHVEARVTTLKLS
jgi:hypothetical protein